METKEDWIGSVKAKANPENPSVATKGETNYEGTTIGTQELQEQKPKKMCLQALDIQIKLFGYTSVLLLRRSWLEFIQK